MNDPLVLFDFPSPSIIDLLIEEAKVPEGWEPFVDPKTNLPIKGWEIKRVPTTGRDFASQYVRDWFVSMLNLEGADVRPRFYRQQPGKVIKLHRDRGTECSINVVLEGQDDYIAFETSKTKYACALLNTQAQHGVLSPTTGRLLFKLSIFDRPYQEVLDVLQTKLSCRQAVFEALHEEELRAVSSS